MWVRRTVIVFPPTNPKVTWDFNHSYTPGHKDLALSCPSKQGRAEYYRVLRSSWTLAYSLCAEARIKLFSSHDGDSASLPWVMTSVFPASKPWGKSLTSYKLYYKFKIFLLSRVLLFLMNCIKHLTDCKIFLLFFNLHSEFLWALYILWGFVLFCFIGLFCFVLFCHGYQAWKLWFYVFIFNESRDSNVTKWVLELEL